MTVNFSIGKYGQYAFLLLGVVLFIALGITLQSGKTDVYAQGSDSSISGYAWSSNIGWISFSGSGYGLTVSSTGVITGYGWSSNIGWVSANSSDLSGCPSAPCTATIDSSGALQGWLRAISGGSSQSGGWDGFIRLSGSNYGPVRQSNGAFSGYAWGSDVVGWLDFQYATTDFAAEPSADLKVRIIGQTTWEDSLTIQPTEEIELSWNESSTANTESCQAVPPAYGFSTEGATSGLDSEVDEPVGNTNNVYRVICYSESGAQKIDTVTVSTVGGVGAQFCPGSETDFVRRNADVNLCWELGTNDPSMCSIKAGGTDVLNPLGSITGNTTHNMVGEVTFTLECIGGDGDTMTTKVLPEVQET